MYLRGYLQGSENGRVVTIDRIGGGNMCYHRCVQSTAVGGKMLHR